MLERGKIPHSHFILLIIGYTFSGALFMSGPLSVAKHDIWLAILAGLGVGLFFMYIYVSLAEKFPGLTLIKIMDVIYGYYLGKIISAFYVGHFLLIAALNLRVLGNFFTSTVMPETPLLVFLVLLVLVCASAVRNGIEVIARCSIVLTALIVIQLTFSTALAVKDLELTNFLPVFDLSLQDFIKASHIVAVVPFGETVVFLMVIAFLNDVGQAKRSVALALITASIFLIIAEIRDIGILGALAPFQTYPALEAVRFINVRDIITRIEIIIINAYIAIIFLKVTVLYYATVLGTAQLLQLRSYRPLVLPVGALVVSLSVLVVEFSGEVMKFITNTYPFYCLPFEVGIPLLSLIITNLKELSTRKKGAC